MTFPLARVQGCAIEGVYPSCLNVGRRGAKGPGHRQGRIPFQS